MSARLLCAGALVALVYWLKGKRIASCGPTRKRCSPLPAFRFPFGTITGLGKKKWDDKGLATVRYEIDGRKGEFILDDYKFDRDATHQILAEIEERLLRKQSGIGVNQ